tara:strand:- start:39 stop:890 length:852 start_codon:yes stop_codon:yes gene_type:complete
MISIIGIGTGGSAMADQFQNVGNYEVYKLNKNVKRTTKSSFPLPDYRTPEEYENNIPDLTEFFKSVRERAQVFIVGASMSSNYVLGILQQICDKEIDLFYIKPDTEMLTGTPLLLENMVFGILQEYARSGLFKSVTLISNPHLESVLGEVPIKNYYETLNKSIFSTIHYLNYFEFTDPEIGQVAYPAEINRIRSIAMLEIETLEEKWLFDLDTPRELCYYICINDDRLNTEGGLHKKIVDLLKEKPKNAFRKISYAIYGTEHSDFGFCVAHTNVVQEQKTLDS